MALSSERLIPRLIMAPAVALALTLSGSLIVGCGIAKADTLLIQNVDAGSADAAERPKAGTSMADVEARFGAPASRSDAIGKPPITRWDYPGFVVYFEYNHVIHAVRR